MAELIIREVEAEIVSKLKERADEHRRSVEEEHRQILRAALFPREKTPPLSTFEAYLRMMPDVGTDVDFARIHGSIRDITLSE